MRVDSTIGFDDDRPPSASQRLLARGQSLLRERWWLFLLPVIVLGGYGAYKAATLDTSYKSEGTLSLTEQSFIAKLSDDGTTQTAFEPIATRLSREFNGLLTTDVFARTVVTTAGLGDQLDSGQLTLDEVRVEILATASGDSLMKIVAIDSDPTRATNLATSAIDSYRDWVLDAEVSASDAAATFFDDQLRGYETAIDTANDALDAYLTAHPQPANTTIQRDIAEQLQIERLNDKVSEAQARYDTAVDKRDEAKLASVQSGADIGQRLQIVDEPSFPTSPEASLPKRVTTLLLFGILGVLLSMCVLAAMTVLDRTIHDADDLAAIGLQSLGTVPRDTDAIATAPRMLRRRSAPSEEVMRDAG